jgi:hypothetical protein
MAKKSGQKKRSLVGRIVDKVRRKKKPPAAQATPESRNKILEKKMEEGTPSDQPSDPTDVHNTPGTSIASPTPLTEPTRL